MINYSLNDIKLLISRRVGDPFGDTYKDRAEDYFIQALTTVIANQEECNIEEAPSLIKVVNIFLPEKIGTIDTASINPSIIRIDRIYQEITSTDITYIKFDRVPFEEFQDIMANKHKRPSYSEGYYSTTNSKVNYIFGKANPSVTFKCELVISPRIAITIPTMDLVTQYNFSERLILKCVDYAVKLLKQEISME